MAVSESMRDPVTVRDLLELPILQLARPEVISGDTSRTVRWLHTSEIFEIHSLLEGDELLLTTGLGLVREPARRLGAYVAELAERSVAGLVLELGRTFAEPPEAMVEAARERDFLFIVLHDVVPWVHVTEAAHRVLVTDEVARLRAAKSLNREFMLAIAKGAELDVALSIAERALGQPVGIRAADGTQRWSDQQVRRVSSASEGLEVLLANSSVVDAELFDIVAQVLPAAFALQTHGEGGRASQRRQRISDIVTDAPHLDARHRRVLAEVGLEPSRRRSVMPFALVTPDPTGLAIRVESVGDRHFENCVATEVGDGIVFIGAGPTPARVRGEEAVLQFAAQLRRDLGACVLIEGEPQRSLAGLGNELHELEMLMTNPAIRRANRLVVTQRETTLLRLISHLDDARAIERFVAHELGPVLEHDARQRPSLMPSLLVWLSSDSKATAAARLGVSRQTMHQRAQLLEGLLDIGPDAPLERRAAVTLAALLWQWRTRSAV